MKKLLFLIILFVLAGCEKQPEPTVLNLVITQNPVGGYNVRTLTTTVAGSISGELKPVTVTVEWYWESASHANQTIRSKTTMPFNKPELTSFTCNLIADAGYYHFNYFWAKIYWTDSKGLHTIESTKCYCN